MQFCPRAAWMSHLYVTQVTSHRRGEVQNERCNQNHSYENCEISPFFSLPCSFLLLPLLFFFLLFFFFFWFFQSLGTVCPSHYLIAAKVAAGRVVGEELYSQAGLCWEQYGPLNWSCQQVSGREAERKAGRCVARVSVAPKKNKIKRCDWPKHIYILFQCVILHFRAVASPSG